jgi:multimeric flavodoxin WrbA
VKIVGVCGSPRRGNTEWMLDQVMEECLRAGAEVETLFLRKLNIQLCHGCLACELGGRERKGACIIKDGMNGIYPKLLAADAIVLATPVYFSLLSGLLKNFMDRTCAIWPRLEGKRLAGLAVAEEGIGQAIRNLKVYGDLCGMEWVGSVTALAKRPGEAARVKRLETRLKQLGRKIADQD